MNESEFFCTLQFTRLVFAKSATTSTSFTLVSDVASGAVIVTQGFSVSTLMLDEVDVLVFHAQSTALIM